MNDDGREPRAMLAPNDVLDCEVLATRSGALAIRDRITGQVMHPVVGPRVEAPHLYIGPSRLEARLRRETGREPTDASARDDAFVLLDIGLGAGSNAIATWRVSESLPASCRRLELVSFDRSMDAIELGLRPELAASFGFEGAAGDAARALLAHGRYETERPTWRLNAGDLLPALAREPAASADLPFWDVFSPRANPEQWTLTAFTALRRVCRAGAIVHTFSGATAVCTALLLAGFAVGTRNDVGGLDRERSGRWCTLRR